MQTAQNVVRRETRPVRVLKDVYTLPRMLSDEQIAYVISLAGAQVHHTEGHHEVANKPHRLPYVADIIFRSIVDECVVPRAYAVDKQMKVYRLPAGKGEVRPHVDADYDGPDGSRALWSILIFLNDAYIGGQTVFRKDAVAPKAVVGGGLLFKHDVLHEGMIVEGGEKFVLKTDLFCK